MERRKLPYPGVWLFTGYGSVYARFRPNIIEIRTRPEQPFLIDGERGIVRLEIKKNKGGKWVPEKLVATQPRDLDPRTVREIRGVLIRQALSVIEDPVFSIEIERITLHNMQVDTLDWLDKYTRERDELNSRIRGETDEATERVLASERDTITERIIAFKENFWELEHSMDALLAGDGANAV